MDIDKKVCEARCCAAKWAAEYVGRIEKGRDTFQDFVTLILIDSWLDALERYKNSLPLDHDCCCGCTEEPTYSCLTEEQVSAILEQVNTICGGCSCSCP